MAKTLYIPDEEEYTTAHTPLLRSFPRDPEDGLEEPTPRTQRSTYHVLGLVLTIVFAADLAGSISKAPLIRVYESIICNSYYKTADPGLIKNGQVEEWYCKVAPVQEELALLRGWHDFFDYLPGTLSTYRVDRRRFLGRSTMTSRGKPSPSPLRAIYMSWFQLKRASVTFPRLHLVGP